MKSLPIVLILGFMLMVSCNKKSAKDKSVTLNTTNLPQPQKPIPIGVVQTQVNWLGFSENGTEFTFLVQSVLSEGQGAPSLTQGDSLSLKTANLTSEIKQELNSLKLNENITVSLRSTKKMGDESPLLHLISISK